MRLALVRASLLFLVAAFAVSTGSGRPNPQDPKVPDKKEPPSPTDPPEVLKAAKQPLRVPPVPADKVPVKVLDSAFPDLKPPTREYKQGPDGKPIVEEKGVVPLPPFPVVKADAPILRKVQYEQMREGFEYIYRIRSLEAIQGRSGDFRINLTVTAETYQLAADLEDTAAKRVPWYEARVRAFKEIEQYTQNRTAVGTAPPQEVNVVRMERLKAEADLLKLKAEVEKAVK